MAVADAMAAFIVEAADGTAWALKDTDLLPSAGG
jgi:hypothetical protein